MITKLDDFNQAIANGMVKAWSEPIRNIKKKVPLDAAHAREFKSLEEVAEAIYHMKVEETMKSLKVWQLYPTFKKVEVK